VGLGREKAVDKSSQKGYTEDTKQEEFDLHRANTCAVNYEQSPGRQGEYMPWRPLFVLFLFQEVRVCYQILVRRCIWIQG
jgi:hypothetical protein